MGDGKAISGVLEAQTWLEPVAEQLQNAAKVAFDAAGPAKKPIENALNGVWLGHPVHPALVEVPVGAWTVTAVLDVLEETGKDGYGLGADAALAIGLVGAASAALTGLAQWYPVKDASVRKVGGAHALLNITATALYAASYVSRKRGDRATGRLFGWLGYGTLLAGAYLGGQLTFEQGMGVDHALRQNLPEDFTPVLDAADLAEDRPTKAKAGDIPLVLVRRGDRIHALADTCSHFGGPLSEGKLDGDCITCPWHGSRFRLADGHVEDGPATFPQPCFETRIVAGQVQVRANPKLPQNNL
jgi:nitrite reductase/ring-hydroxylating ferredoxin subunit/uncharacterized membrane protein